MKENTTSQSGLFNPRVLFAFALCSAGLFLAMLSFAATSQNGMAGSNASSPGDSLFVDKHGGQLNSKAAATAASTPLGLAAPAAPSPVPSGSFTAVGSMTSTRYQHTATLLGNGKILLTGGGAFVSGSSVPTNTAELFDPTTGTFTSLPPMTWTRQEHTATLLQNGKVLIAGGYGQGSNTAELFDPATNTFALLSNGMISSRWAHTATLLQNGKVLLAGGQPGGQTAELFDPATETFAPLPNLISERRGHTATLLASGQVLIAGGNPGNAANTNTTELFDPASGTFTAGPSMNEGRFYHTATLLPGGQVLMTGGAGAYNGAFTESMNTAELFDPSLGMFILLPPMTLPRYAHTATLLPNGNVLLTGGSYGVTGTNTAELFDATSMTFVALSSMMTSSREFHSATLLPSGQILVAGGVTTTGSSVVYLNTAEIFNSASGAFTSLLPNAMTTGRNSDTATLLGDGKVLIAGGATDDPNNLVANTAELFDPASGAFTATSPMASVRYLHTATLLPSGKVLIAGGSTSPAPTNEAELFDPASATFTSLSPMTSARYSHTATLLPSGKVLLAGGYDGAVKTNTAELFDPATGTFTSLSPNTMNSVRYLHTATLLPSGKVLIAGGYITNTAELFDPALATFTSLSPNTMTSARYDHTATLLPSGKVLIAGGQNSNGYLSTAELFNPATGTFTPLPNMTSARSGHSATVLPSGQVVMAGGNSKNNPAGGVFINTPTNTAELFDPALGTFTSLSPNTMTSVRVLQTATLLPSGQVLIAGGNTAIVPTNTADLFDAGLGFSDASRPVVSTATNPVVQPASLVLTGSGFRDNSEASGGSYNNSATNYPVLQLQRIDNEQVFFPLSDSTTNWSDTTFTSAMLGAMTPFPIGYYRVTVFTNAIPSFQKIIYIKSATPVQLVSAVSRKVHGAAGTFDIDLPLTGTRGVECRSGGTNSAYTIVFTFLNPVTNCGAASTGLVSSGPNPNQCTVNLTGVPNAQYTTVTLTGVVDSMGATGNVSGTMGVLIGDVNATGLVDGNDVSAVQGQARQTANSTNFRLDVNTTGLIDGNDVSLVQSKTRTSLP